ncbi:MAG: YbhB/YbcL family Raf kinase inhibitor-like protein [Alphaproteobacteria bacterium]|jgi:hypothetical protein|nr:YbhB/YbcL family Raf kinase inhibitor-like protein [Rhodospirillaceae bacterium]MDP6403941.1 YbhB/YbcL family Raf kinase inhibitor-like protein [Alphaproteobacteria bacterium]MDP6622705.1 YbhB/YbcL family Raf kinase inhibitor-like protein [Alphaproteobacteria bacterium]|tara:strand:+ start:1927 stop:2562 length:636 start_codon:yes stop_codon:yes gene_type:complete
MSAQLNVTVDGIADGERIPEEFAFCVPDDPGPTTMGANKSPGMSWSGAPDGTKSFAVICHDADVPTVFDDVNQEGKTIPASLARMDFFHWVLVDIPASTSSLAAEAESAGIEAGGKATGPTANGLRGKNNFGDFFAGDPDMAGDYGGYDGPCPPWNDEIIHHYVFTVFALDVESLGLEGLFGGPEARAAMEGHVLAEGQVVGTYTLNPSLL